MFTFQQLTKIIGGKILSFDEDSAIKNYIFDSRKVFLPSFSIFIAIKGKYHDGHEFINELSEKGLKNFIVEKEIDPPVGTNVVLVENSIQSLQELSIAHRSQFHLPVVAITGSNGKTIIKEWLSQLLSNKFNLVKSPKSYNSQLGVPLSVLKISPENDLGIFEAGISKPGEMEKLNRIIQPTFGVFTNLGSAHDSGFADRSEKVKEKWKLFAGTNKVVYCKDHIEIDESKPTDITSFTWGRESKSDVRIVEIKKKYTSTLINITFNNADFWIEIPFQEQAYLENAMHVISMGLLLDLSVENIQSSMLELKSVPMRLEVKRGFNQCIIIDDTYNNDLAGILSGIEFLSNHSRGKKKTLILSDILTVHSDNHIYQELSDTIINSSLDRFIGVGKNLKKAKELFPVNSQFYTSTDELYDQIDNLQFSNEAILIKGARPFGFERITQKLSEKIHGTKLEINLDALSHNLNFYKTLLQPNVKVMVMVKAFAYGTGSTEIANLLQFHNVDYLAVAYADEGVNLRKQGISAPVMVMNISPDSFDKIIEYRLEPEIYSQSQLEEFCQFLEKNNVSSFIHLKVDTGMKRLGFEEGDIDMVKQYFRRERSVKVASIFTHLAGSDEEIHNAFSLDQLKEFKKIALDISGTLGYRPLFHALNSPGIVRFPDFQMDMVRLGIGLYGYESCGIYQDKLEPISILKTEISQIKELKKGETVGYGRKGKADRDLKIATIAIGYADGFSRAFSNGKISVNVNGKLAPVIGNVCMDMTMIDITGIDAHVGDEVIIFGKNPTIQDLANAIGTIPYEILTNVSERVKRIYYSE